MPRKPSYPGPYVCEFPYAVTIGTLTLNHTHTINVKPVGDPVPGTVASSILLSTGGGGTKALDAAMNQYWSFLRAIVATGAAVSPVNFYRVEPESSEKVFITSVNLTTPTAIGGTAQPAREDTLTFRSGLGSYMQVNVIEVSVINEVSVALVPNAAGNNYQRLASYVLSVDGVLTCRDRTFPIGAMKISNTQNEVTYRKRWRA